MDTPLPLPTHSGLSGGLGLRREASPPTGLHYFRGLHPCLVRIGIFYLNLGSVSPRSFRRKPASGGPAPLPALPVPKALRPKISNLCLAHQGSGSQFYALEGLRLFVLTGLHSALSNTDISTTWSDLSGTAPLALPSLYWTSRSLYHLRLIRRYWTAQKGFPHRRAQPTFGD
jgi:hypothetical protein